MAATGTAVLQSQPGASVLAAFPQTPGTATQNLDLLQILDEGGAALARVDYTGAVTGGALNGLVLTSVAVTSFVLTQITASTGVVLGTFTGGAANAFAGKQVKILGFVNGGNNGTFNITASTATQITITPIAGLVDETHAATASVYGVSTATYAGTITGGGASAFAGRTAVVAGFTNSINNIAATAITSSSAVQVVVPFAGQIAETHAGTVTIGAASLTGTNGTRVGVFYTRLTASATIAQLFADAFTNSVQLDILHVVNLGGNVSYYLDYLGVSHGS